MKSNLNSSTSMFVGLAIVSFVGALLACGGRFLAAAFAIVRVYTTAGRPRWLQLLDVSPRSALQPGTLRRNLQLRHCGGDHQCSVAADVQQRPAPSSYPRGANTGSVMDSTGGNLSARFQGNLAHLLAAIKAAGFVEIEVGFFPRAANDPTRWATFSSHYFQENWSVIQNLHPIVAGAGIPYHIDLQNEGIPPLGYDALLQYDQNAVERLRSCLRERRHSGVFDHCRCRARWAGEYGIWSQCIRQQRFA